MEAMAREKMTMSRVLFNGESSGEKPQWRFCREEVLSLEPTHFSLYSRWNREASSFSSSLSPVVAAAVETVDGAAAFSCRRSIRTTTHGGYFSPMKRRRMYYRSRS
ncbi:hypothetical protein Lalb_Chr25g0284621 [Lupinus albus]|uniref:Uncharacterized protein n=1 Tax=Lupinus albus TaxID=3870 RepID=A0A6A4NC67_LUPAL|nr:hypothetical protein Lalb_Chr25g0284621 [Lupinus albus]